MSEFGYDSRNPFSVGISEGLQPTDTNEVSEPIDPEMIDEIVQRGPEVTGIVSRAARGAVALLVRQVIVYGSNIAGGVVLARILAPEHFGFYGIVLFFVAFLNIFGGTGFAANLIRMPESPTQYETRVVFTAQQILVGLIFLVMWFFSPWISSLYHMQEGGTFFRLIAVALTLTSLMVMPQVSLERELNFDRLAVIEVAQAIAFNASSVLFAWKGYGEESFALALVVRALSGVLIAYVISPWKIGFAWDWRLLRTHARFGIAFQVGKLMSMLKDSVTPILVGLLLGAAAVGYVTWANTLAGYAVLMLIPFQRLYLPFFARLQDNRRELARVVSRAMWAANAIVAPLTIITIVLSRPITSFVFGEKWLVALPLYLCFCVSNLFSACSGPMLGVLNALGKSKITLAITVMWSLATWLFALPLVHVAGVVGFGLAMICVQLTNLVLYWVVWREISLSPWPSYWPSWPLAAGIGAMLLVLQRIHPIANISNLLLFAAGAFAIYAATLWGLFPQRRSAVIRLLRKPAAA